MVYLDTKGTPEAGEVSRLLQGHGITPTQQRIKIAAIILDRPQHLSADQVLARVNQDGQQASKATIYNTLGLFARKGLVTQVIVDPTKVFYDSNTDPHHHFYDVDNGVLTDIAADEVSISGLPALPKGTQVSDIDITVRVRRSS